MKVFITLISMFMMSLVVTAQDDISTELQEQIDTIEDITSDIRDLEEQEPIALKFPSRNDLRAFLIIELEEQLAPEIIIQEMHFYTAFDLLDPDLDILNFYLDLYESQIAGFYDPETKEMNVILINGAELSDSLPLLERITYSHEYIHALQDQYFDLDSLLNNAIESNEPDYVLAIQALVEGDASYAMQVYTVIETQQNPIGALAQLLLQGLQAGSLTLPAGTPGVIETELLFPYMEGAEFVTALYNEGGWELVNNAYSNPPRTTEQILHPEKYINGEQAIEVTLNDDSALLGDGWSLAVGRTLGEVYLREHLATQLRSSQVNRASSGWGGDEFNIYTHDDGTQAWVLKLVWDTPQDADEFYATYQEFGNAKFGFAVNGPCWSNDVESLCIVPQEGATIITQATSRELASILMSQYE